MNLSKVERDELRMKFGGLCAYCGHPLPVRWHADHFEAVHRGLAWKNHKLVSGKPFRPERDVIENLMPACPPCNISKHTLGLEAWRSWLAGHMKSLNEHHSIYRLMKAYGLVVETSQPIIFHFEKHAAAIQSAAGERERVIEECAALVIALGHCKDPEYVAERIRTLSHPAPDTVRVPVGNAVCMGLVEITDIGLNTPFGLVIEFAGKEDAREAIAQQRCAFTVFGKQPPAAAQSAKQRGTLGGDGGGG